MADDYYSKRSPFASSQARQLDNQCLSSKTNIREFIRYYSSGQEEQLKDIAYSVSCRKALGMFPVYVCTINAKEQDMKRLSNILSEREKNASGYLESEDATKVDRISVNIRRNGLRCGLDIYMMLYVI